MWNVLRRMAAKPRLIATKSQTQPNGSAGVKQRHTPCMCVDIWVEASERDE